MARKETWVYFDDGTAVREADYRKQPDLQKKTVEFHMVDGVKTEGKPKAERATPAKKADGE